ncbi:hypothetical protein NIES4075_45250 [Tolypothrix sp. NIES-4075]|uniref:hypothetical protein n=1 Tax=Tolypothrix sp. NIES-4075 TaxID=2005459 RepID=UPI000B6F6647|nr:hypothetical protein [Tolypothrix sp. NIES-4075]GAX43510.1 hypothetical protein NIES4075_45250 [Tolypothrix sp. NIES-4075]
MLGLYLGVKAGKLRYFTLDGDLVPTLEEAAIAERQRALEAKLRLQQEQMRYMQLLLQELSLYLGILEGRLRYFNQHGELIPTPEEAALQERQQAETERQRAEKAEAKTAILTQRLRELGIDPDNLP